MLRIERRNETGRAPIVCEVLGLPSRCRSRKWLRLSYQLFNTMVVVSRSTLWLFSSIFAPWFRKILNSRLNDCLVVQSFSDFQIAGIHRGIIIVFAAWSPLAIMAVRRVTRILATLHADSLDVIVLDNDCMT